MKLNAVIFWYLILIIGFNDETYGTIINKFEDTEIRGKSFFLNF